MAKPDSTYDPIIRRTMPELDAVRGIAILLVVFFHGFGGTDRARIPPLARLFVIATSPGWMGVNLFFVLSGFLITGILLRSREKPSYYKEFYLRRALRILPAYYLVLAVLWCLPRLGLVDDRQISWQFVGLSFVYLANVTNLFGVLMQYGPLWSLAVEEHFYLLWPSAVRLFSRRNLAYLAGALVIGCPILRGIAYVRGYEYGNGYTWLVADGLASGALLAIYCHRAGVDRAGLKWLSTLCILASVAMLTVGLPLGIGLSSRFAGGTLRPTMLNLLFAGSLGVTLLAGTSRWKSWVQQPVLAFFGEISYGLYLIHMLVWDVYDHFAKRYFPSFSAVGVQGSFLRVMVRFAAACAIAVAIAYISRHTFEAYFLRLKDRWSSNRELLEPAGNNAETALRIA